MSYIYVMSRREPNLENTLRDALKNSGLSTYKLEDLSGVPQAVIYRFISGQRSVTLPTASKLAHAMGLGLRPKHKNIMK